MTGCTGFCLVMSRTRFYLAESGYTTNRDDLWLVPSALQGINTASTQDCKHLEPAVSCPGAPGVSTIPFCRRCKATINGFITEGARAAAEIELNHQSQNVSGRSSDAVVEIVECLGRLCRSDCCAQFNHGFHKQRGYLCHCCSVQLIEDTDSNLYRFT